MDHEDYEFALFDRDLVFDCKLILRFMEYYINFIWDYIQYPVLKCVLSIVMACH